MNTIVNLLMQGLCLKNEDYDKTNCAKQRCLQEAEFCKTPNQR